MGEKEKELKKKTEYIKQNKIKTLRTWRETAYTASTLHHFNWNTFSKMPHKRIKKSFCWLLLECQERQNQELIIKVHNIFP